jgi:hypothetical protein
MFVNHHIKYKEIHGVDEEINMDKGEHDKLHKRLRKEGKCKIPAKKLHEISKAAYYRTPRGKSIRSIYNKQVQRLKFRETIGRKILLWEEIAYNSNTGNVSLISFFQGNGIHIPIIDEIQKEGFIFAKV